MERNDALDGARAVAVLAVLAFHTAPAAVPGGFLGVDVFFVLSGYLITTLLIREVDRTGRVDFLAFYARRAVRLVPPLAAFLLVYLALGPLLWPEMPVVEHFRDTALVVLQVSDYARAFFDAPDLLSHSWSLVVEERFYLIWPLLLAWLWRSRSRSECLRVVLLAYAVCIGWRWLNVDQYGDWDLVYYRFDTRLSGLMLGAALALHAGSGARLSRPWAEGTAVASLAVLAACFLVARWKGPLAMTVGMGLAEIASAGLILALTGARGWCHRILAWRPVAFLGLISYAMYLWHYPIARYLRDDHEPLVVFLAVTAATVAIAALSWFAIERPLATYRRRRIAVAAAVA